MAQLTLAALTDAQVRRTLVECLRVQHSALTDAEFSERVRSFTRQQYVVVFGNRDIRKAQMTTQQRAQLRQHEITTIQMLMSIQQQDRGQV